jgi:histidinol-phosphate aminotransferase
VIDEAYIDFTSATSFAAHLPAYGNLIVLQTFSKAWGLAGLRLGMAFASPEIIDVLNKIKYPYNINIRTQELAIEAMKAVDKREIAVKEIVAQRTALKEALLKLPITEQVYPSEANFLLVKVTDAPAIYRYLMDRRIIVRDRSKVALCNNCIRITVGTPTENKSLMSALENYEKGSVY